MYSVTQDSLNADWLSMVLMHQIMDTTLCLGTDGTRRFVSIAVSFDIVLVVQDLPGLLRTRGYRQELKVIATILLSCDARTLVRIAESALVIGLGSMRVLTPRWSTSPLLFTASLRAPDNRARQA